VFELPEGWRVESRPQLFSQLFEHIVKLCTGGSAKYQNYTVHKIYITVLIGLLQSKNSIFS